MSQVLQDIPFLLLSAPLLGVVHHVVVTQFMFRSVINKKYKRTHITT